VKRLLLIVVVAALALTLVPLALAGAPGGGGWKHGKAKFNLVGIVAEPGADATLGTLTIKVKAGTKTVRALVRSEVPATIAVDPGAKIWLLAEDGAVAKTLADIAVGDKVKARGTIVRVAAGNGVITSVYTIKNLKYHVLTPPVAP
jgi:hypothetical protein